jgi:hypothetical protein
MSLKRALPDSSIRDELSFGDDESSSDVLLLECIKLVAFAGLVAKESSLGKELTVLNSTKSTSVIVRELCGLSDCD